MYLYTAGRDIEMIVTEAVPEDTLILIAYYFHIPTLLAQLLNIVVQIRLGQAPQTAPDPAGRTLLQHDPVRHPIREDQESHCLDRKGLAGPW